MVVADCEGGGFGVEVGLSVELWVNCCGLLFGVDDVVGYCLGHSLRGMR